MGGGGRVPSKSPIVVATARLSLHQLSTAGGVTAQSQHSHSTVTAQPQHSHSTVTAHLSLHQLPTAGGVVGEFHFSEADPTVTLNADSWMTLVITATKRCLKT